MTTLRGQIMAKVVEVLEAMPGPPTDTIDFNAVYRSQYGGPPKADPPSLYVFGGREGKSKGAGPRYTGRLPVTVQIRVAQTVMPSLGPEEFAELLIGDVERTILAAYADHEFANLGVRDLELVANDWDLDGTPDSDLLEAEVEFDVTYAHSHRTPDAV